ncbi:hypothetical protein KKB43_01095 [Patescibacteria group bacterium]|nr:hypothetical protein [Patescibacteria group bacterium]
MKIQILDKMYKQFKAKLLKDKDIQEAYDKLGAEFAVAKMIIQKKTVKNKSIPLFYEKRNRKIS